MLIELLCIAAVYTGGIAYAQWVARYRGRSLKEQRRYVLVAGNDEANIEWYLRALRWYSRRSGTDVQMTVWLRDSSDETGSIVRQMARGDDGIDWKRSESLTEEEAEWKLGSRADELSSWTSSAVGSVAGGYGDVASGGGTNLMADWTAAGLLAEEQDSELLIEGQGQDTGLIAGGDGTELLADSKRAEPLTDTRLEAAQPIWIFLSRPEDVARLPI